MGERAKWEKGSTRRPRASETRWSRAESGPPIPPYDYCDFAQPFAGEGTFSQKPTALFFLRRRYRLICPAFHAVLTGHTWNTLSGYSRTHRVLAAALKGAHGVRTGYSRTHGVLTAAL